MEIPNVVTQVMERIEGYKYDFDSSDVRVLLVGGAVRDLMMGLTPKDFDCEIYGMPAEVLEHLLTRVFGDVDVVGRSFGVFKIKHLGVDFDISLPRRENKEGKGHKGFMVQADPTMTVEEASARRDFTINSMALDVNGQLIDPHGGERDLKQRRLRHTSEHFGEDPLRVLRGMQLASRFDLIVELGTAKLCTSLRNEYKDLPVERVWAEWWKWASKSAIPSRGINFLMATNWLSLYSEIFNMWNVQQDHIWHPEGEVLSHVLYVCDAMAEIAQREKMDEERRGMFVLAALCHDMGKPAFTKFEEGRWRARGHEKGGVPFAESFLNSIGCPAAIKDRVLPLVYDHLAHQNSETIGDAAIRRLARRLAPSTIADLVLLIEADSSGRPPIPKGCPDSALELLERSKTMNVDKGGPKAILLGRHLIEYNICSPGKQMGVILKAAFEAQLDGAFENVESGLVWLTVNGHGQE